MKAALALVSALFLAAPSDPSTHGPVYAGPPPERYMGEGAGVVFFVTDVGKLCGAIPGATVYACSWRTKDGTPIMALPLPQTYTGRVPYEALIVHEIGHWRGWGGDHPL